MYQIHFRAMNCHMAAFIDYETAQASKVLEEVPGWFEEWEQILSRFRADSELNRLNTSNGLACQVEPVLWEVVQTALEVARSTDGLVIPTALRSLEIAGYNRSFNLIKSHQGPEPLGELPEVDPPNLGLSDWMNIWTDEHTHSIYLPPGVKLDLGGVAKGWAAQQAMLRLKNFGPALVDAGGDIAVSDSMKDGSPWPVAITDPLHVQDHLDILALGKCGVATSGVDYRRWVKNGMWKHHIIDPRSGEPAETDLVSVTIVAPDVIQAEAAAKRALILGSQSGLAWLEAQADISGVLALQDGSLIYTSYMREFIWS